MFKAIVITGSEEKVLTHISQLYAEIVMRFALLGRIDTETVVEIVKGFNKGMQMQLEKCILQPESDVDFMGEASFEEHDGRLRNVLAGLSASVKDGGGNMNDILDCYLVSLIWDMTRRTRGSDEQKAAIMDYAMKQGNLDLGITGFDIVQGMKCDGKIRNILMAVLDGFLVIVTGMSQECGDENKAVEFCRECAGYMIALEKKLSARFPDGGFKNLGQQVMSEQVGSIAEKVKPGHAH